MKATRKCRRCNQTKRLSDRDFSPSKGEHYGFSYICLSCKKQRGRKKESKPSHRKCSKCGEVRPLNNYYFSKLKSNCFGYGYSCCYCNSAMALKQTMRRLCKKHGFISLEKRIQKEEKNLKIKKQFLMELKGINHKEGEMNESHMGS